MLNIYYTVLLLSLSYSWGISFIENTDIITIATGGYHARSLVKSLRQKGHWRSSIYVISDDCTTPINHTFNVHVPRTSTPLESKIHKMSILNYTYSEYVLFLDSDIKIVNNLNYFFNQIPTWDPACQVYLGHDMWYSQKFTYNGGIILVKRHHSEHFLEIWKNTILSNTYEGQKDQPGLKKIIDHQLISVCPLPQETIQYLPDKSGHLRKPNVIFKHAMRLKKNKDKC